jgi:phage regulator Rha-like protein
MQSLTINSRDVAAMVEKEHAELLKDIRRYVEYFNEGKIPCVEFFNESCYIDSKNETRPCYNVTRKGCDNAKQVKMLSIFNIPF